MKFQQYHCNYLSIRLLPELPFTGQGQVNPISFIPPTKTVNFIIKVTPDTAFSGTGVTSLGGMTGDIVCGTGLTCSGNTINTSFSRQYY